MTMQIDIIGAGAWGTALAIQACRNPNNRVRLWTKLATEAQALAAQGFNQRYLPGIALAANLTIDHLEQPQSIAALQASDLLVLATPMSALRSLLQHINQNCRPAPSVVWLSKGFEQATAPHQIGLMPHEVQQLVAPELITGIFSGPTFAEEVALGKPCAIVAATKHVLVHQQLTQAFHYDNMRVYQSHDIIGVEVGGAVKNVLAIAVGFCDELNLGHNARAALISRGLAEMTRFGLALGATLDTFMGLSGVGDLVLTSTGDLSRNRRVGKLLAQGKTLQQAVESLGHVAEGVYSATTVVQRAQQLDIEMPIAELVVKLIENKIPPQQVVQQLMQRQAKAEKPDL